MKYQTSGRVCIPLSMSTAVSIVFQCATDLGTELDNNSIIKTRYLQHIINMFSGFIMLRDAAQRVSKYDYSALGIKVQDDMSYRVSTHICSLQLWFLSKLITCCTYLTEYGVLSTYVLSCSGTNATPISEFIYVCTDLRVHNGFEL